MTIAKQDQHEQERAIFACRVEQGTQKIREWLHRERDELNAKWPAMLDHDLAAAQGQAQMLARLLRVIEDGPRIK